MSKRKCRAPLLPYFILLKSSIRRPQLGLMPVQVGPAYNSPALSPLSSRSTNDNGSVEQFPQTKQTPLQRHLAHLARHGFNGVSSGPGDAGGDNLSEESPRDSFIATGGIPITSLSGAASISQTTMGGSIGSIRGRLSKFSSLNFARRDI